VAAHFGGDLSLANVDPRHAAKIREHLPAHDASHLTG
jgi:hypothetical protein